MIVTVPKIGSGAAEDPFRPDTTAENWTMLEETGDEYKIEIREDQEPEVVMM